jgi:hypothetical protein
VRQIDALLDELVPALEEVLDEVAADGAGSERWLLVKRKDNLALSEAPEAEPHNLLTGEVNSGADAAVFVSLIRGYSEHVLAYILVADPRDSDIRRSHVTRSTDGTVTLSAWEYTV